MATDAPPNRPILVVGAGMSGLTAARTLAQSGHPVLVVDKGRSPGGRLATRRIGAATLDHGAQFFTIKGDRFATLVDTARRSDLVIDWSRAGPDAPVRHGVRGGMTALAKLMAAELDVRLDTRVEAIAGATDHWQLSTNQGALEASAIIVTAPVPQALELLAAGATELDPRQRSRLEAIDYHPTLAALVVLDGPSSVPAPGSWSAPDGPFSFVADNAQKGISDATGLTLHLTHELSRTLWDTDPDQVLSFVHDHALHFYGSASVLDAHLKRWRFAQPIDPLGTGCEVLRVDSLVGVLAGDGFTAGSVEGAHRSGIAAAEALQRAWLHHE